MYLDSLMFHYGTGKDKVIFVTKDDQQTPSKLTLDEYSDGEPGM